GRGGHAAHASCAAPRLPHPCQHPGPDPRPLARGRTRDAHAGGILPRLVVGPFPYAAFPTLVGKRNRETLGRNFQRDCRVRILTPAVAPPACAGTFHRALPT